MKTRMAVFVRTVREFIENSRNFRIGFAALACLLLALSTGCGGGGSSPIQPPPKEAAPSNLRYPQTSITAIIGQAITPDVPTVSGNVTSYTVDPALPAGLSLNTSTGAISGTPTATAAGITYTVIATNSIGSTTAAVQITVNDGPPANLVYPQTTITAVVGQAITPDIPTVTGTVAAYAVDPALPAGLNLESSTGAISGTPTNIAATATYVVTATNSSGSTTASVQITVNVAPPANLTYTQPTIYASVGRAITPEIPSVTGTVSSFTVAPPLPAGLNFDTTNGVISGTATAVVPTATYTVTAANMSGSASTAVEIHVIKPLTSLLHLGHEGAVRALEIEQSRVLSADNHGFWALWDYDSGALVADGDLTGDVGMAGPTLVTVIDNGLEIRSVSDGHVLFTIMRPSTIPSWWRLSTDGSYVCLGSQNGISVWTSAGENIMTKPGDYSQAATFAAPQEIRIASGPAGSNVIETISVSDGTSAISQPFSGNFYSWFIDGERFFTRLSLAVRIYSKSGVQENMLTLPTDSFAGMGNWFWATTYDSPDVFHDTLSIYPLNGTDPIAAYNPKSNGKYYVSGPTIAFTPYGDGAISVVDLSGATPQKNDYAIPFAYLSAYAATSSTNWIVANEHGAVLDGTSLATQPRYFASGAAWSIAGGENRVAISTANGAITSFDPALTVPEGSIYFPASKLALSSDGTVLAASANSIDAQYETDRTVNIYSLPAGSLLKNYPFIYNGNPTNLFDFSLSTSGNALGLVMGDWDGNTWTYTRKVVSTTEGLPFWSETGIQRSTPLEISPDGTLVALSSREGLDSATSIFKNGALIAAIPGYVVGWIDDSSLLVNTYVAVPCTVSHCSPPPYKYNGAQIYSPDGTILSSSGLPELNEIQTVAPDLIYSRAKNSIFSISTGEAIWIGPYPVTGVGAVSGHYVVFQAARHVFVDTY